MIIPPTIVAAIRFMTSAPAPWLQGAPDALAQLGRAGSLRGRDNVTRWCAKYAKTIVEVGRYRPRAFSRVAGRPLEFVPLANPSTLTAGATLSLRVLYRGDCGDEGVIGQVKRR